MQIGCARREATGLCQRSNAKVISQPWDLPPRLILAARALRIHPANLSVLRYFSPEVDWELIALSEHWRNELKIVFRKRLV